MSTSLIDCHTHVGVDLMFSIRGHYPYAQDWPTLVRLGEEEGIRKFMVFPMITNLSLNFEEMLHGRISREGGLERVPYAVENRRMMQEIVRYFPETADRAYPLWIVDPGHEQKAQVGALRALLQEYPCSGLKIQGTIIQSRVDELLRTGECLLDFAEEEGLPFIIHSSINPADEWSQVKDILKVVEARPGIRFCLAHSCRFDREGLDRIAELPNAWYDCSAHRIHCMLAVQNAPAIAVESRRFITDYRDPIQVLHEMAKAYPEKLMWGSDSPFDSYVDEDIALRSSYKEEAKVLFGLDAEDQERIAHKNTLRFLKGA